MPNHNKKGVRNSFRFSPPSLPFFTYNAVYPPFSTDHSCFFSMDSAKPFWHRIVAGAQYFFVVACKLATKIPLTDLAFSLALAREIIVDVVVNEVASSGYYCDAYGNCYSNSPNYMHKRYYDSSEDPLASMHFTTFAV